MHEWALAESVVSKASQMAEEEGIREVTEVKVKVGELQHLEMEIFKFALFQLKNSKLEKAKIDIETVKANLKCRACGKQWVFDRDEMDTDTAEAIHFVPEIVHTYIKCPKCGSPDFEILRGRGVWLESVRGRK